VLHTPNVTSASAETMSEQRFETRIIFW